MQELKSLLTSIRFASRPFVTRTLRGKNARKLWALSGVGALLTVVMGIWLALGSGAFEREMRTTFGAEENRWQREHRGFMVEVDSPARYAQLVEERDAILDTPAGRPVPHSQLSSTMRDGLNALVHLSQSGTTRSNLADLVPAAERILARRGDHFELDRDVYGSYDPYYDQDERTRIRSIVEARGVPQVVLYSSPLGLMDAVRAVGLVAGLWLSLLFLIVAPLAVGSILAQEVHENTLQPVAGSPLGPGQLAVGLAAGPYVAVSIVAAPLLLLLIGTAAVAGYVTSAIAFVLATIVGSALLAVIAQHVALSVGRRWSPALAAVPLLGFTSALWMSGAGFGHELRDSTKGMVALCPPAGSLHLLRESFVPARVLTISQSWTLDLILFASSLAFLGLSAIGLAALRNRLGLRSRAPLGRAAAMATAGLCVTLTAMAMPEGAREATDSVAYYIATLGLLLAPFAVLVQGRVPPGARMRRGWIGPIAAEYLAYLVMHGAMIAFTARGNGFGMVQPIGLFHLAWTAAVVPLLAIRLAAAPITLRGLGLTGLVIMVAGLELGNTVALADDVQAPLMLLSELSPTLGFVQGVALIVLPALLWRAIVPRSRPRAPTGR